MYACNYKQTKLLLRIFLFVKQNIFDSFLVIKIYIDMIYVKLRSSIKNQTIEKDPPIICLTLKLQIEQRAFDIYEGTIMFGIKGVCSINSKTAYIITYKREIENKY